MADTPLGVSVPAASGTRRHLWDGVLRLAAAEALLPVTGLVTVVVLTRGLGAHGYGLLVLGATLLGGAEWSVSALLSRPASKWVSEGDSPSVERAIHRLYAGFGLGMGVLLFGFAAPLAAAFEEPDLVPVLRLFALDLPLFALAQSHAALLVGRGLYRERASARAARWIARFVLIVTLMALGLGLTGAVLASVGASLAEWLVARRHRPLEAPVAAAPVNRDFWGFAVPYFVAALNLKLLAADIAFVKALGGTTAETGLYGAARACNMPLGLVGLALSPLLFTTLVTLRARGEHVEARGVAKAALRLISLALPFVALGAGAAHEAVALLFGASFAGASTLTAVLLPSGLAVALMTSAVAVLGAFGRVRLAACLTAFVPLGAVLGYLWLIPRYGALGAAGATLAATAAGACLTLEATRRGCGAGLPRASVVRLLLLAGCGFAMGRLVPAPAFWVVPKLAAGAGALLWALFASGELRRDQLNTLRSLLLAPQV